MPNEDTNTFNPTEVDTEAQLAALRSIQGQWQENVEDKVNAKNNTPPQAIIPKPTDHQSVVGDRQRALSETVHPAAQINPKSSIGIALRKSNEIGRTRSQKHTKKKPQKSKMSEPESSDCDESSSSDDDSSSTDETPSSEPSDPGSESDQCPKKKGKKFKKTRKEKREKMTDHLPVFKPLVENTR